LAQTGMKLTKMRSKFFQYHIFLLLFITSGKVIAEPSLEAKLKMQRDNQAYTPLQVVQPRYPSKAQRKGTEGYAIVSFTITKKGTTEDALVVEGKCGDIYGEKAYMTDCTDFNASSLKATKKLRYRPAEINGSPVKVDNVLYRFRYEMGGEKKTKPILNIPSRDLYVIESWISSKKLDKAEKKSLGLVASYEDVNFLLGKIYALKNQDALAIEHFNRFLKVNYDYEGNNLRHTLEISAVAIIVEKLFKVEDYSGIIRLAPRINNSRIILTDNNFQNKNANNLIDISYFYLGASYVMEDMPNEGKEALLFVKKRAKDKNFLNDINNYLLQAQ